MQYSQEKLFILRFIAETAMHRQQRQFHDASNSKLKKLDWAWIVKTCTWQRLGGFLFVYLEEQNILSCLPETIFQDLVKAKNAATQAATEKMHQLKEVVAILNASDIAVILLKGTSLLTSVYKDRPFRKMHDLDILIAKEQVEKAFVILKKNDFVASPSIFCNRWHEKIHQQVQEGLTAQQLQREPYVKGDLQIDLHWNLFYEALNCYLNLDIDALWKTKEQDFSLGPQVYRLNLKYQCLSILLHCNDFNSPSLTQLLDLCVLKHRYQGNLDDALKEIVGDSAGKAILELKELIQSIPSAENLTVPYESLPIAHLKIYEIFFNQTRRDRLQADKDRTVAFKKKMTAKQKLLFYFGYLFPDPRYYQNTPMLLRYFKHWKALIIKVVRKVRKVKS
jgi:hypothetical protein